MLIFIRQKSAQSCTVTQYLLNMIFFCQETLLTTLLVKNLAYLPYGIDVLILTKRKISDLNKGVNRLIEAS